jgi:hypothetical protein
VIPADWQPVHRDDGELVGYLAGGVPMTLIGQPLEGGTLEERGLVAIDGRWQARLPATLPAGILDASHPAAEWEWRNVVIVEVSPAECRVRLLTGAPEQLLSHATLPLPVGGLLRREP